MDPDLVPALHDCVKCIVAYPGCLSRIRIFSVKNPGSDKGGGGEKKIEILSSLS
jgi:hypothetical protein